MTSSATLVGCDNLSFNTSNLDKQSVSCNVTFGDETWVSDVVTISWQQKGDGGALLMPEPGQVVSTLNGQSGPYINQTILGVQSPFMGLASLSIGGVGFWTSQKEPGRSFKFRNATTCVLSMCARTYNISVMNGVPSIKTSSPNWGDLFTHEYNGNQSMACWKPGTSGSVNVAPIQQNATEFAVCLIREPDTEYYASLLTTRSDAKALSYNATDATWYPSHDYSEASTADRNYLSAMRAQTVGFDTMVTNIAKSWTRFALTTNDSAVAQGAALVPQTYIQVDWPFLTLPAVAFLLSSVFLVATVVLNNRRHVILWKSSILPLIYHGLAEPLHDNQHTTISKMEQQAQSVDVKLQFTDRKLTLRE